MGRPRVLDLFSGGGGSSYGARNAGCEILAGVDAWSVAAETYRDNFPEGKGLHYHLDGDQVRAEVQQVGTVDLLLASPECTNHTPARGARPSCETSRMTAWQVLHHARHFNPRWIVIENVVNIRRWNRYDEFLNEIRALGYDPQPVVIDAADLGVPQNRRRLFIVCQRDGRPVDLTVPPNKLRTVREILERPGNWPMSPLRTPRRAGATLERAERAIEALGTKQSFLLVYYGSDYGGEGLGGWQPLDRPLRTLTTLDRFALVQPTPEGHAMRMLQVPELRRAMGFRDDFKLARGTRRDQVKLLGNGVCPPVMEHIATCLQRADESVARARREVTLSAPLARTQPT